MKYKKDVTQPATGKSVGLNSAACKSSGTLVYQPKAWSIEMALGKPPVFWIANNAYKMTGQHFIQADLCN